MPQHAEDIDLTHVTDAPLPPATGHREPSSSESGSEVTVMLQRPADETVAGLATRHGHLTL